MTSTVTGGIQLSNWSITSMGITPGISHWDSTDLAVVVKVHEHYKRQSMRRRAVNSCIENPSPIIKHKAVNSVPCVRSEPKFSC